LTNESQWSGAILNNLKIFQGNFSNGAADYIAVDMETGVIASMGKGTPPREADVVFSGASELLPGDFNAHSHPEQSLYVEIVDPKWNLSEWCRNTIYRYSSTMTRERVYYACVRAFGRMLSYGVTSVMVSFYCHNKKGNELDLAVIQAAKDVGIRLYFGRMNYDLVSPTAYPEKQASQRSYYESPEEAAKNFIALLSEECATVRVAPALHSFHANTQYGIISGINLGAEYNRVVQMHLSEDEGDVNLALEEYGLRPVEALASLRDSGKISRLDHMLLSDCVWTDEREKELIRDYEMAVVMDGRMNERVEAGRADVRKYLEMGIRLYVGTDGEASNDDLSIQNEKAWLVREHNLSPDEEKRLSPSFEMAGMKVGTLEVGSAADFKVVENGALKALYVGGRPVMEDGRLLASDLADEADAAIQEMWRTI
jgi:5-methylthioadenosine/S-adenosylhomocysteine deaminase